MNKKDFQLYYEKNSTLYRIKEKENSLTYNYLLSIWNECASHFNKNKTAIVKYLNKDNWQKLIKDLNINDKNGGKEIISNHILKIKYGNTVVCKIYGEKELPLEEDFLSNEINILFYSNHSLELVLNNTQSVKLINNNQHLKDILQNGFENVKEFLKWGNEDPRINVFLEKEIFQQLIYAIYPPNTNDYLITDFDKTIKVVIKFNNLKTIRYGNNLINIYNEISAKDKLDFSEKKFYIKKYEFNF